MENEHGGIGGNAVDLIECRHSAFRVLEFGPAADDADPLGGRGTQDLLFEHAKGIGEGGHAVPTQLEVIIQSAADQVNVRVVQSGYDAFFFQVDYGGVCAPQGHDHLIDAYFDKPAVSDGYRGRFRLDVVDRMDLP